MADYHYTECGLDNVIVHGVDFVRDDRGEMTVAITAVNLLHTTIAVGIVSHENAMSPQEMKFLRTNLGLTQAQLGEVLRVTKLTIGRWESGSHPIDEASEVLMRMLVVERLLERLDDYVNKFDVRVDQLLRKLRVSVQSMSTRVTRIADRQVIEIQKTESGYELQAA